MLLKFCTCDNLLNINTVKNVLYCGVCGEEYPIKDRGTLISTGHAQSATYIAGKYDSFIRNSGSDPTNKKVIRDCEKCGLDYMTLVFVGENKKAVYTCKCLK
jgi:DNA-directed RNA polymerase subunit M/transcription elongation factor TFIIS